MKQVNLRWLDIGLRLCLHQGEDARHRITSSVKIAGLHAIESAELCVTQVKKFDFLGNNSTGCYRDAY
jgi:hypothetical protein